MRNTSVRRASLAAVTALVLLVVAAITESDALVASQAEDVQVQNLFSSPVLKPLPPDTSVSLFRLTLQPGATHDVDLPGPVICYVESGSLAVREPRSGSPQVLLYSGPEKSPPPLGSDKRDSVLPPGYAVLVEDGTLGLIRNPGNDPAVVLLLHLVPENLAEGEMVAAEATSVPTSP
jgi:hypothetical protein